MPSPVEALPCGSRSTINTFSLKADNPIAINFIGSDTGGITVTSKQNVTLNGNLTAKNGDVTICAGVTACGAAPTGTASIIDGNDGAVITAKAIELQASGSIGGVAPDASGPRNCPYSFSTSRIPSRSSTSRTAVARSVSTLIDTVCVDQSSSKSSPMQPNLMLPHVAVAR